MCFTQVFKPEMELVQKLTFYNRKPIAGTAECIAEKHSKQRELIPGLTATFQTNSITLGSSFYLSRPQNPHLLSLSIVFHPLAYFI